MSDVIVVGGRSDRPLSIVYELAGQAVAVTVLEQGQFGQEASWARAGILPPGNPSVATEPEARLRWRELPPVAKVEWRNCWRQPASTTAFAAGGGMEVTFDDTDMQLLARKSPLWKSEGVEVEELTPARAFRLRTRAHGTCHGRVSAAATGPGAGTRAI